MSPARSSSSFLRRRLPAGLALLLAAAWLLTGTGCLSFKREAPRPGLTTFGTPLVVLPAATLGNYLVIEAKWDRYGPYRFLIDTGSSVTLVSTELARRYPVKYTPATTAPQVRVKSAEGEIALLATTTLRRLDLGDVRFDDVPALMYDCAPLSAHLGVKIDGILGFPLFRDTVLTLDYPHSRVLLSPSRTAPLLPGSTIPFNNANKTPLIPISMGDTPFIALIDSGSDAPLSLNPVGLQPKFAVAPRPGPTVGTLTGDRTQQLGRLADSLKIGTYALQSPLVEMTDELSAIGAAILKNFTITFDQKRNQVTFYRETADPIAFPPHRTTGLSFNKAPAYWRVVGIVPGSPATGRISSGDLVTRINGEPVERWDFKRYGQLIANADDIVFTLLNGSREHDERLKVYELVP